MDWGRSQKYHSRQRFLYSLTWNGARPRVYIGQTVDPTRREQQHRGSWSQRDFTFRVLGSMTGTQAQGEDWEYAWRYVAHQAGFEVVAKTIGGVAFTVRNPQRRMTRERYLIAAQCQWPTQRVRGGRWSWLFHWLGWQGAAIAGVLMLLRLPLP